jgi:hypothetical protein
MHDWHALLHLGSAQYKKSRGPILDPASTGSYSYQTSDLAVSCRSIPEVSGHLNVRYREELLFSQDEWQLILTNCFSNRALMSSHS